MLKGRTPNQAKKSTLGTVQGARPSCWQTPDHQARAPRLLCNSVPLNLFQGSFPRVQLFIKQQLGSGTAWLNVTFVADCCILYSDTASPSSPVKHMMTQDVCHCVKLVEQGNVSNGVCVRHVGVTHSVCRLRHMIWNPLTSHISGGNFQTRAREWLKKKEKRKKKKIIQSPFSIIT